MPGAFLPDSEILPVATEKIFGFDPAVRGQSRRALKIRDPATRIPCQANPNSEAEKNDDAEPKEKNGSYHLQLGHALLRAGHRV